LARRLGNGQHHRYRTPVVPGDGRGEIGRERCNSAAARTVRADERYGDSAIDRLDSGDARRTVGGWARIAAHVIVGNDRGHERH
jgi:hypothetical protein